MERVAEKYGGSLIAKQSGDVFYLDIILLNKIKIFPLAAVFSRTAAFCADFDVKMTVYAILIVNFLFF